MQATAVRKTLESGADFAVSAGTQVVGTGRKLLRMRRKVSSAVADGLDNARRTANRGMHAAEDLKDDTAHAIKRHPLRAIAITAGVGFGSGFLLGWLLSRRK
jgi:ElaB/YqjD/DUF883 family membrane-anchored ribosome-binding protein